MAETCKKGYVGGISGNGSQYVKRPVADAGKHPGGTVKRGNDLRTGKK